MPDTGPFTLASHLRGSDLFMDMFDREEYVHSLLDYCTQVACKMAEYYVDAGMDVIAVVDPLISQISTSAFETFMADPSPFLFARIVNWGLLFLLCLR